MQCNGMGYAWVTEDVFCLACWQPRYNEEISFNVQKVSKYDQEMPPIVQCRPTQGTMRKGHREISAI